MRIEGGNGNYSTSFGKFIRIDGKFKQLEHFRTKLRKSSEDYLTTLDGGANRRSRLYLISGKDLDTFIDLMKQHIYFRELRENLEKYMPQKPKKLSVKAAFKKLKNDKF